MIRGGRDALPALWKKTTITAAWASIDDVWAWTASVDAQVRVVLGRVMAQRRSVEVAFGYLSALAPGIKANCWSVAEEAGHEGPHRMQALLGSYRWDWARTCAASSRRWPRRGCRATRMT